MALDLNDLPVRVDVIGASEYLQLKHGIVRSPQTLAKYRSTGGGPRFRKAGRRALYDIDMLDEYAQGVLGDAYSNTSEYSADDPERTMSGV